MQPSYMPPSQLQRLSGAPGDLYNASLALCLRVNELMQIGGQQWVESGTRLIESAVTESTADLARLAKSEPGPSTTNATMDVLRGGVKRWSVQAQTLRSTAFEQQRSLSTGLREAVTTWSKSVNAPHARTDGIPSFADAWLAELTKWTQAWPIAGKAK